ncbi:hypothetical protein ABZ858_22515 [Streptomyces sp. NPDC047017]|uniref:hypothetical protein n=1 Tax=Streptomyces sp. NPDC047017 TaxID=3155024 RepID=UPI0034053ADD
MPATEHQPRPYATAGVRMSDLLASCAAAEAVSRPPRAPEPAAPHSDARQDALPDTRPDTRPVDEHRRAA